MESGNAEAAVAQRWQRSPLEGGCRGWVVTAPDGREWAGGMPALVKAARLVGVDIVEGATAGGIASELQDAGCVVLARDMPVQVAAGGVDAPGESAADGGAPDAGEAGGLRPDVCARLLAGLALDWEMGAHLAYVAMTGRARDLSPGAKFDYRGCQVRVHGAAASADAVGPVVLKSDRGRRVALGSADHRAAAASGRAAARDAVAAAKGGELARLAAVRPSSRRDVLNRADRGTARTREGVEKMRSSRIAYLVKRGRLALEHQAAAEDIEFVHMAIARRMGLKAQRYERAPDGASRDRDPLSSMTRAEWRCYRRHYLPWIALMEALPLAHRRAGRKAVTLYPCGVALVTAVVCDNRALDDVSKGLGLAGGVAVELLVLALHRYCQVAGWVDAPEWLRPMAERAVQRRLDAREALDARGGADGNAGGAG